MIAKYRKKPVVIEVVQYTGDNAEEIFEWMNKTSTCAAYIDPDEDNSLMIITLEGEMQCRPGWYVLRGVRNEFYPCDPDIFAETYEEVDHEQT